MSGRPVAMVAMWSMMHYSSLSTPIRANCFHRDSWRKHVSRSDFDTRNPNVVGAECLLQCELCTVVPQVNVVLDPTHLDAVEEFDDGVTVGLKNVLNVA